MTTEYREGLLIRITDRMANLTLLPLTRSTATELRHLARKVDELLGEARC